MPSQLLQSLGFRRSGQVNCTPPAVRVQHPIQGTAKTTPKAPGISKLPSTNGKIQGATRLHPGDASKRGDRKGQLYITRFLQQDVRGTQEQWKVETHNRPVSIEQIDQHNEVQDGDTSHHPNISIQRTMDDNHRPYGCLLPHPHSRELQEVPEVLLSRKHLPVQSTVFRAFHSTTDLHRDCQTSHPHPTQGGYKDPPIPGRLALCGNDQGGSCQQHVPGIAAHQTPWPKGQQGQIRADAPDQDNLPRHHHRLSHLQSLPSFTEGGQPSIADKQVPAGNVSTSLAMAPIAGTSCIPGETGQGRKEKDPTAAVPTKGELDLQKEQVQKDLPLTRVQISSGMVVKPQQTGGGSLSGATTLRLPPLHRRFQGRMGSRAESSTVLRSVDKGGVSNSHQQPGTGSCIQGPQGIPELPTGLNSCRDVGQHHSGCLHQQTRGDTLQTALSPNHTSPRLGRQSRNHAGLHLRTRKTKRDSRLPESEEPNPQDRVVASPKCLPSHLQTVDNTVDGSLCHQPQQQTPLLLLTGSRPREPRDRCFYTELEEASSLRLPSSNLNKSYHQQGKRRGHGNNPCSATVAKPGLVSGPIGPPHRPSCLPTSSEEALETTTQEHFPQLSRNSQSTRLEIITGHLEEEGFSTAVAKIIAGHNRESTQLLYQSKWKSFADWCHTRQTNPLKATIPLVADFLLYLFNEKGQKMSTIKGYRSAIAQVLSTQGVDVTNDTRLTRLIRSLDIKRPTISSTTPKWDLALVLRNLTRAPYEPLNRSSMKHLSHKTLFLLGLASAKRIGEIHALSANVNHTEHWTSVSIEFDTAFLAKTQDPGDPSTSRRFLRIPALGPTLDSSLVEDRSLCPVRALKHYLHRTKSLRANRSRLFIPLAPGRTKQLSKATLSNWVKDVIKSAHRTATDSDARLSRCNAHELRALATSVLFTHTHSLSSVMEAACWRNHNTFSHFYLRDIALSNSQLSSLGPIVAGQGVIGTADTVSSLV